MDPMITTAARALAAGDPLGALNRVALRDDAPALALRGIAMAQLGDFARARALLRRAARAFGPGEAVSRARCVVAEAEVAMASRDLGWPTHALRTARATLERHGDRANVAHARLLEIRYLLLMGHVDLAERGLAALGVRSLVPALRSVYELATAGIAIRRLRTMEARAALARARRAARDAGIPALLGEVETAADALKAPAARQVGSGAERLLRLGEVEALLASNALVVDACRHAVHRGSIMISLAKRPVLFAILRTLAEAWPGDVSRDALVARAFGVGRADASHRARLRVEVGRLRRILRTLAGLRATQDGFVLVSKGRTQPRTPSRGRTTTRRARATRRSHEVTVLAPPVEGEHGAVLALLADGESWSSSALALALGVSQRTVQRALDGLLAVGQVRGSGRGRARRWIAPPLPGITTALLLPVTASAG